MYDHIHSYVFPFFSFFTLFPLFLSTELLSCVRSHETYWGYKNESNTVWKFRKSSIELKRWVVRCRLWGRHWTSSINRRIWKWTKYSSFCNEKKGKLGKLTKKKVSIWIIPYSKQKVYVWGGVGGAVRGHSGGMNSLCKDIEFWKLYRAMIGELWYTQNFCVEVLKETFRKISYGACFFQDHNVMPPPTLHKHIELIGNNIFLNWDMTKSCPFLQKVSVALYHL